MAKDSEVGSHEIPLEMKGSLKLKMIEAIEKAIIN